MEDVMNTLQAILTSLDYFGATLDAMRARLDAISEHIAYMRADEGGAEIAEIAEEDASVGVPAIVSADGESFSATQEDIDKMIECMRV